VIVSALQKYEFFTLFPINPSTLAKYRQAFRPSRAKDDPSDAKLALDLLQRHPERFAPLRPQSASMRSLTSLIEQRRQLVGDKIRFTNRLRSALKQYFPQTLDWFEHIDTMLFCDFLSRWPTLSALKRASSKTLEAFFLAHNCRRARLIDQRLESIRAAAALTVDPGIVTPYRIAACSLAALGTRPSALVLYMLLLLAGATTIGTLAVFGAFAAQSYPVHVRVTGVSYASAAGRLGAMAGPLVGGTLVSLNLAFHENFMAFAVPAIVAVIAVWWLKQRPLAQPV
jgi:hypothetical protein